MLEKAQSAVADFHKTFGLHIASFPSIPPIAVARLRIDLIQEEAKETVDALLLQSLPDIADGIADLIYVLLGTAESYGLDMSPIFAAVHKANMAKEGGATREDGKILKPEGWKHPDIEGLIQDQTP